MQRFPAFDPPEYVDWKPDPAAQAEFAAALVADPERAAVIEALAPQRHLDLYAGLVRNRLHDIALKRWVKQGVLSKAWLGTGEEASTIGVCAALEPGDQVGPMIRNAGACHERGMPVADMLRAYLGTYDTLTRGRDLHTGDPARGVIPPISMVAALVPVFAGVALAFRLRNQPNVAVTWVGDGATRTQDFHEGASLAAARKVPLVLVLQNNQVALGTPLAVGVSGDLRELHRAYGVRGLSCAGNNVLDVHAAAVLAVAHARKGDGTVFLHTETFRMGGHATHDEAEARGTFPADVFAHWGRRDPIGLYETWLAESGPKLRKGRANRAVLEETEAKVAAEVDAAAADALRSRETAVPPPESLEDGVWARPVD
jgi:TPP-dependent pyruvate/acetoin dehydrogenase alpha subunit